MPSLKVIRKRIATTKATQKITRAMKMVAGARLTRAQQRILSTRPYAVKTAEVLASVARTLPSEESQDEPEHALLAVRPEKRVLYLVFTADRGLCGALNTNVTKATERAWREKEAAGASVSFATLGRKGREHLARRQAKVIRDFRHIYDGLDLIKARSVAQWVVSRFEKAEVDAIYLVFNEFKSAITQKVTIERLLPLGDRGDRVERNRATEKIAPADYIFEPDRFSLIQRLVPMYVEITIYRALLESQASFFGAQMTAMDAATRNAKEMIGRLTLQYNRARQAAITKELMEIIGGAEALNG